MKNPLENKKMEMNMKTSKSTTELFLNDFEVQNWELDSKIKEKLSKKSRIIFSLFSLDLLICHILIGLLHLLSDL